MGWGEVACMKKDWTDNMKTCCARESMDMEKVYLLTHAFRGSEGSLSGLKFIQQVILSAV